MFPLRSFFILFPYTTLFRSVQIFVLSLVSSIKRKVKKETSPTAGISRKSLVGRDPARVLGRSVWHARGRLKDGGREGIRTPGLLVANEEKSKLRLGATVT